GFLSTGYARFNEAPTRRTRYYIRSRSDFACWEDSNSDVLVIDVRRRIRLTAADREVRRGRPIAFSGQIYPGDRAVAVRLQRRTSRGWVTLKSVRTTRGGRYAVVATARRLGFNTFRIQVGTVGGNLGAVSPSLTVKVNRNPPPASPSSTVVNPTPPDYVDDDLKARASTGARRT
ncbi:hypothetical protein, partial [Microbacterium pseudoresistens]|uniref:hypothetical protein n=1 Tax=Microbacterium pseudoresistens TaxID=640634 RepID=UPI0031EA7573